MHSLTDEQGLQKAYDNMNNRSHYDESTKTLFIAGTNPLDPHDLYADAQLLMKRPLENTQRYKSMSELIELYNPDTLVGHSLSSAMIIEYVEKSPNIAAVRVYGSPIVSGSKPSRNITRYKHPLDLIAYADQGAKTVLNKKSYNPHSFKGFKTL